MTQAIYWFQFCRPYFGERLIDSQWCRMMLDEAAVDKSQCGGRGLIYYFGDGSSLVASDTAEFVNSPRQAVMRGME